MKSEKIDGGICFGLCRSVTDTAGTWFHTIPAPGEYPDMEIHVPGQDEPIVGTIVIAPSDYQEILAAFRADQAKPEFHGLLVDKEHFSLDVDKSSEACAWAEDMRIDTDGIWTRWKLTAIGKPLIEGDVYRGRSPVFNLKKILDRVGCWRMTHLLSIALTNTPFFRNLSPEARARGEQQKGGAMLLEKLRARFKLDAAADEQAVLAKATELLDKGDADAQALGTARARVTELETADRTRAWDAFYAANKDRIADDAAIKAKFMANPDDVLGMFKALKPAAQPQAAARRIGEGAGTPTGSPQGAGKKVDQAAVRKLAAEIQKNEKCRPSFAMAKAERILRSEQGQ